MTQKELAKLIVDSSEKDVKAEILMDYVLSWCLKRADEICKTDNKPIYMNIADFC